MDILAIIIFIFRSFQQITKKDQELLIFIQSGKAYANKVNISLTRRQAIECSLHKQESIKINLKLSVHLPPVEDKEIHSHIMVHFPDNWSACVLVLYYIGPCLLDYFSVY